MTAITSTLTQLFLIAGTIATGIAVAWMTIWVVQFVRALVWDGR